MALLKHRSFEPRLVTVKYQLLKSYPEIGDPEKVAAVQSIYDAAVNSEDLDTSLFPTSVFGVDLSWSGRNNKTLSLDIGSISISDDLTDDTKATVPGLGSGGGVGGGADILFTPWPYEFGTLETSYGAIQVINESSNWVPLNNDVNIGDLTFEYYGEGQVWTDYGRLGTVISGVEGQDYSRRLNLYELDVYGTTLIKITGSGYKTTYINHFGAS